jgi:hypothetical protein
MAQIAITRLADGPRNAIYHIALQGDGTGDLVDVAVIDPATDFDPPLPAVPSLRIARLIYDLTGFDAYLEFDYLATDTPIWTMTGNNGGSDLDFCSFGGLSDRSLELDGSGKLLLSTSGLGLGDRGSIIIMAKKS